MFHTYAFDDVMTYEYLKSSIMIVWKLSKLNKKKVLVLKALYFRHTKQSSKNIADATYKACARYFSFFSPNDSP